MITIGLTKCYGEVSQSGTYGSFDEPCKLHAVMGETGLKSKTGNQSRCTVSVVLHNDKDEEIAFHYITVDYDKHTFVSVMKQHLDDVVYEHGCKGFDTHEMARGLEYKL